MSTSAEGTRTLSDLVEHSHTAQPTPVIIKLEDEGQGAAPDEVKFNVEISSPMTFRETPGETWKVAESTFAGRIVEVTIWEDNVPHDIPITLSDSELTSVHIHFGSDVQVILREAGQPNTQDVLLVIESEDVPFNITHGLPREGEWHTSVAEITPRPTRVVVRQGQAVLLGADRELHGSHIQIYPIFNRFTL